MIKPLILVLAILFMNAVNATTLTQLYQQSLKLNEDNQISELAKELTIESVRALTSSLSPSIDLNSRAKYGNETYQGRTGFKKLETSTSIGISQNIFQGGSEFALWELKKTIPEIAKEETKNRYTIYYSELAQSFYAYLSLLEGSEKLKEQKRALEKRVRILEDRVKIGRDRRSDLLASQGQLARLGADLASFETDIVRAATRLRSLTGLQTLPKLNDSLVATGLKLPQNSQNLLDERPLQRSADLALNQTAQEVRIEKSQYYPQLSLEGNYYLDQTRSGRDDYDIALNLKLNIFDFGVTKSNVASKNIAQMIARKRSEQIKRLGIETLNDFNQAIATKKDQLANLAVALRATQDSYNRQLADAGKGLVSQLDVIQSLDSVIALERLNITTSNEIKILYHQGLAFLGILPEAK